MNNNISLDCRSFQSTLHSFSRSYNVNDHELISFLKDIDLDALYEADFDFTMETGDRELIKIFNREYGRRYTRFERIYWFHLTRTLRSADYINQGIIPLGKILDTIWETLFAIAKGTKHEKNLKEMKASKVDNHLFLFKTGNLILHGPYAMLVRESAFCAEEMCNHDYLGIPEIIEDICLAYTKTYSMRIMEMVKKLYLPA